MRSLNTFPRTVPARRLRCLALLLLLPLQALAGPVAGVAIEGGFVAAREGGLSSQGADLGADIQYLVNDDWTLNPWLAASAERARSASMTVSDFMAGIQLRRWWGDRFVGVHLSSHQRLLISGGTTQNTAYGLFAPGLVAGLERPGGWGALVQADLYESGGRTQDHPASASRVAIKFNLSYRWGEGSR